MDESATSPCDAGNAIPLERCPECGYLLAGLPSKGTCPECGFAYDSEMIVLYGWPAGSDRTTVLGPPRWALVLLLGWVAWGGLTLAFWPASLGYRAIFAVPWVVGLVGLAGWCVRVGRDKAAEEACAPYQLRLHRHGFAQRRGFGAVRLRPWGVWRPSRLAWVLIRGPWSRVRKSVRPELHIRQERYFHLCIPGGLFADWGGTSADLMVDLAPEVVERIRRRVRDWQALPTPEETARFWEEYREPTAGST